MATLDINFNDVPLEMPPIDPGTYFLEIVEIPSKETAKDGLSQYLLVKMKIVNDPNFAERRVTDFLSLKEEWLWRINQLVKAAGIEARPEGIDLEEFLGKTVQAQLKSRVYQDKETGENRETVNVSKYVYNQA